MKNLIEMAVVDGNFDTVEFDLLKVIAKRNNISESQLKQIQDNPLGVNFEIPTDPKEKFYQLYDLVHMMTIDKNIHNEEMNLCNLFAVKFGYKRERIGELINIIKSNIQNNQSHEEAMKRAAMFLD